MKRVLRITSILMALVLCFSLCPLFASKTVRAAGGPVLKLHYHRGDGNYNDWDVWMWEAGKDGAGYALADEGGEKVATMEVTPGVTSVGFIVRTSSWTKDINEDQFIDIADVISGTVHIYVESGVKGYTKDYGDDAVVGTKVKSAKYNMDGTLEVTMTGEIGEDPLTVFSLSGNEGAIGLTAASYSGERIYVLTPVHELELYGNSYFVGYEDNQTPVTLPILFSTDEFENEFTYTGDDLGFTWSTEKTDFRVWAPTASEVTLNLYESGDASESDLIKSVDMTKDVCGTWVASVEGNQNGVYYTYSAFVDGELHEACDPYARTTGVNGARAMVIDLDSTNPDGWDADKNPNAGLTINDAIIYEGHIRDLTVNQAGNISHKGKYLGLTESGTRTAGGHETGLDHIKKLGITHLHILPMYDFATVDETSATNKYNWGYDPMNYNVPEGSYSTDPKHGEVRVAEVKQMVQILHNHGISVVMDVVYNHVYNAKEFCFNQLVPGYFSRVTDGVYSNGSGCGNDTATERSMVRKYIVDSVNYWVDEYHIDGFRFDLVGLMDTETINEIVETVHRNHPDVIFYGEGWTLTTNVTKEGVTLCTQPNSYLTPGFAYFNDTIRDGIKGSVFNTGTGFVSGAAGMESKIERCFMGSDTWCKSPSQSINYASCHDNNTLNDRLRVSVKDATDEEIISMNKLAAAIYMTSEGVPFLSAGEEMLRSKVKKDGSYDSNSYASGDTVNSIKWANLDEIAYADLVEYYRGLIAFRKAHPALRLTTAEDVEKYVSVIDGLSSHMTGFKIDGITEPDKKEDLFIFFNANKEAVKYTLPEGDWDIYIDGSQAGCSVIGTVSGEIEIAPVSALVLTKTERFATEETATSAGTASDDSASADSADDATDEISGDDSLSVDSDNAGFKDSVSGKTVALAVGIPAAVVLAAGGTFLAVRNKKKV